MLLVDCRLLSWIHHTRCDVKQKMRLRSGRGRHIARRSGRWHVRESRFQNKQIPVTQIVQQIHDDIPSCPSQAARGSWITLPPITVATVLERRVRQLRSRHVHVPRRVPAICGNQAATSISVDVRGPCLDARAWGSALPWHRRLPLRC